MFKLICYVKNSQKRELKLEQNNICLFLIPLLYYRLNLFLFLKGGKCRIGIEGDKRADA